MSRYNMAGYGVACLLLFSYIHVVDGTSCNLALTATNETSTQVALTGSGICTWTITAQSDNATVYVTFKNITLRPQEVCNASNSILIFNGDGTILGSLCGNNAESSNSVRSSGNNLTIEYAATTVQHDGAFVLEYEESPATSCGFSIQVYSSSEFYALSPGYPDGVAAAWIQCRWGLSSPNKGRIRLTIETADESSLGCQAANATLFQVNEILGVWCPGKENYFQSWENFIYVDMHIAPGQSVKMKYHTLKASTCTGTLSATPRMKTIATPGFPHPFPEYEECRWYISTGVSFGGSIRININESDMESNAGCKTDNLKVYSGYAQENKLVGTTCGNETRSYYVYNPIVTVIFKSWRVNNTRKGVKLQYYHGKDEPCGGSLTANDSAQSVESPGFPIAYPTPFNCTWKITALDPLQFVQVRFIVNSLSSPCGRDGSYVQAFDGNITNGYSIGKACGNSTPTFTSAEQLISIYFKSYFYTDKGFRFQYQQVKKTPPFKRHLVISDKPQILSSPRYPGGQIRDMDCTWTVTTDYIGYYILFSFDKTDLGSGSCTTNYIKVVNVNSTNSQSRTTTLCGQEEAAFLSKGNMLTIMLKTDNNLSTKGFQAKYYRDYFDGCTGKMKTEDADDKIKYIQTPNFPIRYPNNMDCEYLLQIKNNDYVIHAEVVYINMEGGKDCEKDFVEFFDGADSTAKSLGKACGTSKMTVDSSSDEMFVKFISDSHIGGNGCKLSYKAQHKASHSNKLWIILGSCAAGAVCLIVVVIATVCFMKRKRRAEYKQQI